LLTSCNPGKFHLEKLWLAAKAKAPIAIFAVMQLLDMAAIYQTGEWYQLKNELDIYQITF
jgi:hypothetical protein